MPETPPEPEKHTDFGSLVYPIYLDVPMMVSFLAALRDGVEFENTVTRRDQRAVGRASEGSAKMRLPPLASLFGFEASGKMSGTSDDETSEEVRVVRQHTAASLFNALHTTLREDGYLKPVANAADLNEVVPGDVVELAGDFIGNPLESVLAFFRQATPYFEMTRDAMTPSRDELPALRSEALLMEARASELAERSRKAMRSKNPAMKARSLELENETTEAREQAAVLAELLARASSRDDQEQALELLNRVSADLDAAPVQDTVIEAGDLQAVLTMSAEYFTAATRAHLRAGVFRAVGKVTRVLKDDDEINLLRRTVLGSAQPELGRELLQSAVDDETFSLETYDPIIVAPAVQILPLAVFV